MRENISLPKEVWLVGKGPSLDYYDWSKATGPIVCINETAFLIKQCKYAIAIDYEVLHKYELSLDPSITLLRKHEHSHIKIDNVFVWRKGIHAKNLFSTAVVAIQVLKTLGAEIIHFVGFDAIDKRTGYAESVKEIRGEGTNSDGYTKISNQIKETLIKEQVTAIFEHRTIPLVSIMMPAYNASTYIADAIKSVQAQLHTNWELCIVDDGSKDNTYNIAKQYADKDYRIRLRQIPHLGCPTARNTCLDMSCGQIIARLDADDWDHPSRLLDCVTYLQSNPQKDLVTCRMEWVYDDKTRRVCPNTHMKEHTYMRGSVNDGPVNATIVAWKRVYDLVGGFDVSLLAASDGEWNMRACIAGVNWGFIPDVYYYYRRHEKQITLRMNHEQQRNHKQAISKHSNAYLRRETFSNQSTS